MTLSAYETPISNLAINSNTVFVFALDIEAVGVFETRNKLFTGAGKVNAAYELTKFIHLRQPELIVNLGSAGSSHFKRGEVICCTKFLQRDMDATGLGFKKHETPFSGMQPVLNYGIPLQGLPQGICGTGDSFEMNHLSPDYNVIDMEAYPLAYIAMKEQIPFLCLKYITDGADSEAAGDWMVQVHNAASAFEKILLANASAI